MLCNIKVNDINLFISDNLSYVTLSFLSLLISVFLIRKLIIDNLSQ